MKASLPLLSQRFITGLSDELRIACGPSLHAIICDPKKSLDDLIEQVRSMALLLPPSYATANTTRSFPKPKKYDHRRDSIKCNYCRKNVISEEDCRKKKYDQRDGTMHPQQKKNATVLCEEA
jgi:hypothetical protein